MKKEKDLTSLFSYREQVARSISWGHHFLFFNIVLAVIIGYAYLYAAPDTSGFLAFIYLLVTWIGHLSFLAFIVYIVLFFPLSFIGRFRVYRVLAVILAVLSDIALLFDAKLFLAVKVHVSVPILRLIFKDLDFNTGLNYNFLFIAIPLVIALQLLFAKLATRGLYRRGHGRIYKSVLTVVICSFIASHCIHIWADAKNYEQINVMRAVFPAHYPMTARSFLLSHGFLDGAKTGDSADTSVVYPLNPIRLNPESSGYNVLTVFINGLSYADLDVKTTPSLMQLKLEGNSFENHFLPYTNLRDNFFAASYGLPVLYRTTLNREGVFPVTVEELHRQEYTVRLITDSKNALSNTDLMAVLGQRRFKARVLTEAKDAFSETSEFISSQPKDRLYTVNLSLNALTDRNLVKEDRKATLKELDALLGSFITTLTEQGLLDNTLVIISSALGNPELNDSAHRFNQVQQHVPLILRWPHEKLRSVPVTYISSHFDLVPTLGREILGISNECGEYSIGQSLYNLADRSFVVTSYGQSLFLIDGRTVTVYRSNGKVYVDAYGQQQSARPELENLVKAMRELNRFKE